MSELTNLARHLMTPAHASFSDAPDLQHLLVQKTAEAEMGFALAASEFYSQMKLGRALSFNRKRQSELMSRLTEGHDDFHRTQDAVTPKSVKDLRSKREAEYEASANFDSSNLSAKRLKEQFESIIRRAEDPEKIPQSRAEAQKKYRAKTAKVGGGRYGGAIGGAIGGLLDSPRRYRHPGVTMPGVPGMTEGMHIPPTDTTRQGFVGGAIGGAIGAGKGKRLRGAAGGAVGSLAGGMLGANPLGMAGSTLGGALGGHVGQHGFEQTGKDLSAAKAKIQEKIRDRKARKEDAQKTAMFFDLDISGTHTIVDLPPAAAMQLKARGIGVERSTPMAARSFHREEMQNSGMGMPKMAEFPTAPDHLTERDEATRTELIKLLQGYQERSKEAGFFGFGKKKQKPVANLGPLTGEGSPSSHDANLKKVGLTSDEFDHHVKHYDMDHGYVKDMLEDHAHGGFDKDSFHHNVAWMSHMQQATGGPGRVWDHKKWGKDHEQFPVLGQSKKAGLLSKGLAAGGAVAGAVGGSMLDKPNSDMGPGGVARRVGGAVIGGVGGHLAGKALERRRARARQQPMQQKEAMFYDLDIAGEHTIVDLPPAAAMKLKARGIGVERTTAMAARKFHQAGLADVGMHAPKMAFVRALGRKIHEKAPFGEKLELLNQSGDHVTKLPAKSLSDNQYRALGTAAVAVPTLAAAAGGRALYKRHKAKQERSKEAEPDPFLGVAGLSAGGSDPANGVTDMITRGQELPEPDASSKAELTRKLHEKMQNKEAASVLGVGAPVAGAALGGLAARGKAKSLGDVPDAPEGSSRRQRLITKMRQEASKHPNAAGVGGALAGAGAGHSAAELLKHIANGGKETVKG